MSEPSVRPPARLRAANGCGLDSRSRSISMLYLADIVDGASSCMNSVCQAYVADASPPDERAANLGIFQGLSVAGAFVLGIPISALLSAKYGLRVPMFAAAAVGVINFLLIVFITPESLPASQRAHAKVDLASANPLGEMRRLSYRVHHLPPANSHLPPPTSHLPHASCHLPPATSHLPPPTSHLPPAPYHLPPATCLLPPTTCCHLPPASCHLQVRCAGSLRARPSCGARRPPSSSSGWATRASTPSLAITATIGSAGVPNSLHPLASSSGSSSASPPSHSRRGSNPHPHPRARSEAIFTSVHFTSTSLHFTSLHFTPLDLT